MTKPAHREQVTTTAGWMVQAGGGGGGGGGRGGVEASVGGAGLPSSPDHLDTLAQVISQELLDDAILNVVFEVHQSVKTGLMMLELGAVEEEHKFLQVTAEGLDVFGQAPIKKQHECVCPNCARNLAASRFAPHLEKCLGMGRNSSRIASRRIQNSTKENSGHHHSSAAASDDDDDDDDWLIDRKRKKRDKNSPRRSKNAKIKLEGGGVGLSSLATSGSGGGGGGAGVGASAESTLASGTAEEKRAIMRQICGVVSEHTHKMCTRSLRCPQHSHQQRQAVRDQVFNGSAGDLSRPGSQDGRLARGDNNEDMQVDIDGLEEGGHLPWDPDHSNTTSPADSTSTNNSTSSSTLAKRSSSKTKKKSSSKSSKSSSSSHGSLLD